MDISVLNIDCFFKPNFLGQVMVTKNKKIKIESRVGECKKLMPGWEIKINYLPESTDLECVIFSKNGKTFRRELGFILDNSPRFIKGLIEGFYKKNVFD